MQLIGPAQPGSPTSFMRSIGFAIIETAALAYVATVLPLPTSAMVAAALLALALAAGAIASGLRASSLSREVARLRSRDAACCGGTRRRSTPRRR